MSVVIPAKNEARCLPEVLGEMPDGVYEVILVDGDSTDDTAGAALRVRPDLHVVAQSRRGKGNALACGVAACTGDVVVLLDADGSADPAEIADFVAALGAGADFAKGSRFIPGGGSADLTVLRRWGNAALAVVMNRLYRTSFTDLCYGYNAFWRHCAEKLALPDTEGSDSVFGDGFEIETVIAAHVATGGLAVAEVPSFERLRFYGSSNLNTWRDGWRVLRAILRERRGGAGRTRRTILAEPFETVRRP
ncbi:MAG TPA: glycosyltransferase family 2 protein [Actinocrinis sp.]|nr:glycosyltransferase family 2 protein [Actinocrinis sp.]